MSAKNDQTKSIEAKLPWYLKVFNTIKDTPINLTVLLVSAFVFYKVVHMRLRRRNRSLVCDILAYDQSSPKTGLPPLNLNLTVKKLLEYDGSRNDGRILVAVNFNIYDVSLSKQVYGKTGAYPEWAGRDISRNLINFSAKCNENIELDNLSDLTPKQRNTLFEWDQKFSEKCPFVGHLISDDEDEPPLLVEIDEGGDVEINDL